ncbi:hypothetical protein BH20GEM2_BH20GEM2_19030 [soil metagenome]|jgi:predicted O-methyltransferase YrrM
MRTTIDIDRDRLERAKRALAARTYKEAIERSLDDAIRKAEMRRIVDELKGSDVTWDVEELLAYRRRGRDDAS